MNPIVAVIEALSGSRPEPPSPLAPFDPASRGTWTWRKSARFRPHWRMDVDGAPVADLRLFGFLRQNAVASTADATWRLRRTFPLDVLVVPEGDAAPLARYRAGWFAGGRIERPGAETLLWRRDHLWFTHWSLLTPEQLPLVHLRYHRAFSATVRRCDVELEDAARRLPDLALLIALGWYLALRSRRQSHARI